MTDARNYFEELDALRLAYPDLTLNNYGYENIPADVRAANAEGQTKIEAILKATVRDFVSFQNFKPRENGSFDIRCQTRYSPHFTGVSYLPLDYFKPDSPTWSHNQ